MLIFGGTNLTGSTFDIKTLESYHDQCFGHVSDILNDH